MGLLYSFVFSTWWFTTSKAFLASSVAIYRRVLLALASAIASVTRSVAVLGDFPQAKPNWSPLVLMSVLSPDSRQTVSRTLVIIGAMVMPL